MLIALFCLTAFAQKDMEMLPFSEAISAPSTFQGVARQAHSATHQTRSASDNENLVTPPASSTAEVWYTLFGKFYVYSSGWQDKTANMKTVNVVIDGSDIYVQGLSYWFKEAWVKGTIDGTTVTFPGGQLLGSDEEGSVYFCGSDDGVTLAENIIFYYNETAGILQLSTWYILENGSTSKMAIYCYWDGSTFSKTDPETRELVVLPEGVVPVDYVMIYQRNNAPTTIPVKVAVDGNDVYFQGLSHNLPEAWVKGTKDGNIVTFPMMQYMGEVSTYGSSYAFYESDAVFTYDPETESYAAEGLISCVAGGKLYDGKYENPVLKKVIEVAAIPATPAIYSVGENSFGPSVKFDIPLIDVNNNGLVSSKLSYQLFVDVEQTISPLTFKKEYYSNLEEDMTVIPYGFTDNTNFSVSMIYLKMPEFNTFNRIGIQSIYTGGGEENKSEIAWYTIKEYSHAIFNFNAMDVACSSSTSNAGDITEDLTISAGNVTLTVSPATGATPNRFWNSNSGPQLRVYSGTLTFTVPDGKQIKKIVFNNGKWNVNNSADVGAFEGNIWTGEAQEVVVTIAGSTQLNSIDVETADFVLTPVVAPEGLVTEPYIFTSIVEASNSGEKAPGHRAQEAYSYQTEIGFDGNDVYIKGLSDNTAEMWIKATMNEEGKYVIPANQYIGQLNVYGLFIFDYYLAALGADFSAEDIVLDFDEEQSKFTTEQVLILNGSPTEWDPYQVFLGGTFTKFIEVAATPVDPAVEEIRFDAYVPKVYFNVPTEGTNGEALNINKLYYTIWFEKDGEQKPYTFTAAAYNKDFEEDVTEVPYTHSGYDFYPGGEVVYFEDSTDELYSWSKVGIQSIYYGAGECHQSNIVWADNPSYIATRINTTKAADSTDGTIYDMQGRRISNPVKGIYIINHKKVFIK